MSHRSSLPTTAAAATFAECSCSYNIKRSGRGTAAAAREDRDGDVGRNLESRMAVIEGGGAGRDKVRVGEGGVEKLRDGHWIRLSGKVSLVER